MRSARGLLITAVIGCMCHGAALPAQALTDPVLTAVRTGVATIRLPQDSIVVPMVGTPTLPLVQVWLNGAGPFRFLVDLGANVSVLRRGVVDASRATVLVERASSDIVRVEAMRLGSVELREVTFASYDELDVDGVLGYNILQRSAFTLDFPAQRLVLHRRRLPEPDGHTVHRYEVRGRLPYVLARIGNDSILLNLDTGASEEMTVPAEYESRLRWQAPPQPGRATFNNQTGRTVVREGRLDDTVRIGRFSLPAPLVYVNPDAEDAWLGAAAMARYRWTFDPVQLRFRVEVP